MNLNVPGLEDAISELGCDKLSERIVFIGGGYIVF